MTPQPSAVRNWLLGAAVVTGSVLGGGALAGAATSHASTTHPAAPRTAPAGAPARAPDPATMVHGPGETLLTGSDLASATTAALATAPGATVIRAETDSSGDATYEVHLQKTDGSFVTVELDASFTVMKTVDGFGQPPAGKGGPGAPPAGSRPAGTPPTGAPPAGAPFGAHQR